MALGALAGLDIVVVHEPRLKTRTWRERLFSRPWRPWQKTELVVHPLWGILSKETCYQAGRTLYVNPVQFEILERHHGALAATRVNTPPDARMHRVTFPMKG